MRFFVEHYQQNGIKHNGPKQPTKRHLCQYMAKLSRPTNHTPLAPSASTLQSTLLDVVRDQDTWKDHRARVGCGKFAWRTCTNLSDLCQHRLHQPTKFLCTDTNVRVAIGLCAFLRRTHAVAGNGLISSSTGLFTSNFHTSLHEIVENGCIHVVLNTHPKNITQS